MTNLVRRPAPLASSPRGLAGQEHFQVAYVTNDIARARDFYAARLGVTEFRALDSPLAEGGQMRIELAWAGGVMIELIAASGPATAFYNDRLPADEFAIRFHHLGYLVGDEDAWRDLEARIAAQQLRVVSAGDVPGFLRYCYVEVPELGHYLEYIFPTASGAAFFAAVPGW